MTKPKFEVGKTYKTNSEVSDVTVEAIAGGRIFGKATAGYYTMYDLNSKFIGHWWNDGTPTGFYHMTVTDPQGYNLKLPEPDATMRRIFKPGASYTTRPDFLPLNSYNRDAIADSSLYGYEVKVGDGEAVFYSVAEFKNTKYYGKLRA